MKSHLANLSPCVALLAFSLTNGVAQEAYFHRGAQYFLTGSNQLAKAEVERGLQLHPDNPNLRKFWELLNQQQQQQQNSEDQKDQQKDQQQDQQKDQNKQDQQQKDQPQSGKDKEKDKDGKKEGDDKDSQKQDTQQKQPDEKQQQKDQQPASGKDKDQQKKDGQDASPGQQSNPEEDQGSPDGQPQGTASVRMTPQQAVRLLEALKGEERTLQFRPILRTNRSDRILKDW